MLLRRITEHVKIGQRKQYLANQHTQTLLVRLKSRTETSP